MILEQYIRCVANTYLVPLFTEELDRVLLLVVLVGAAARLLVMGDVKGLTSRVGDGIMPTGQPFNAPCEEVSSRELNESIDTVERAGVPPITPPPGPTFEAYACIGGGKSIGDPIPSPNEGKHSI